MGRAPIAYLVGMHPTPSQAFIGREVEGLRRRGVRIVPYALRPTPPDQLLSEADRRAAAETSVVQPPQAGEVVRSLAAAALRSPGRLVATVRHALSLGPGGPRNAAYQLIYLVEGAVLLRRMRRQGIRHVHVHFATSAAMVALLLCRLGGPCWSWSFTMHGPTELDDVRRFALADKVREAAFVACIGDYARSQLMKLVEPAHWSKLEVVRCGVDVAATRVTERPATPDGPVELLCVGRLVPDKGQRTLVDALAGLLGRGAAVRLTFVGDGPDRAALEDRVRELGLQHAVTFAGALGQDGVRAAYAASDALCLPSFAEGIPVVLMEAMASELPVISTRIMGIPELVEDGVSGLLVAPGRPDLLEEALARLVGDPELRRALGAAGRRAVLEEFDADRAAGILLERLVAHGAA